MSTFARSVATSETATCVVPSTEARTVATGAPTSFFTSLTAVPTISTNCCRRGLIVSTVALAPVIESYTEGHHVRIITI